MVVVLHGRVIILVQDAQLDQFPDALVGQIGVDRPRAKTQQSCNLMHISGLSALQDQGDGCALLGLHQVLLNAGNRKQRGDRHVVLVHASVGEDDDIAASGRCAVHRNIELFQRSLQRRILVKEQ